MEDEPGESPDTVQASARQPGKVWVQIVMALIAALGSFMMGTCVGWSGPALVLLKQNQSRHHPLLLLNSLEKPEPRNLSWLAKASEYVHQQEDLLLGSNHFQISDAESDWIGSLMPLGALFGGPLGGLAIGLRGRKFTMFLTSGGMAFSYVVILAAQNVAMILIGRFFTGFFSGIISVTVPIYISEIASPNVRGLLGSFVQVILKLIC